MNKILKTTYKTARFGCCTYSLILDKRHPKAKRDTFPVAMRYTIDRKSWYNYVAGEYTEKDFDRICSLTAKAVRSDMYETKLEFDRLFDEQANMVERLGSNLTLEHIKAVVTGVDRSADASFIGVWEDIIYHLNTDNNGERCTTGESYQCALNSFNKILWKNPIAGFRIGKEEIECWDNGMKHGVKDANGELVGKIADATRGIYLRNCRAVWNECVARGFLVNQEYPFSNIKRKKLVAIPMGDMRKERYLNVEQMTALYNVFVNKQYPESWKKDYTERAHYSLGLFLVQYLCNGFNLVDAAELTYSQYYFDTERRAFKFKRTKTTNRTEGGSEVIIPIIPPLQKILDEIAAKPQLDALVFPEILNGAETKAEKRKRTAQENSNVQDRIVKICQDVLHWEVKPSGTWCRHSYGTNLAHAHVEEKYISESMGHSTSKSITERYIANYPLETQMEYNNKLLDTEPKLTAADIQNMTEEQKTALLLQFLAKG